MEEKASITPIQKDLIVSFLKEHLDLQTGRFSSTLTFKTAQALLEELCVNLNSVPNVAQKDWRLCRKTWQDIQKHTKSKAAGAKRYSMGTGGGEHVILSSSDKEILDIMCPEVIDDIQNVPDTPIVFET